MALIHRFDPPANKQLIPVQDRIPNSERNAGNRAARAQSPFTTQTTQNTLHQIKRSLNAERKSTALTNQHKQTR